MLTDEQVHEAVAQMLTHCELKMRAYELISARSVLYELGYHGQDCEQVLQFIFDGGFTYCLDPGHGDKRVSADACYWGPDQLESRLRCLSNRPSRWA